MAHDGRAIANFVLDFCDEKHRQVTNLALQKIVYFCHVWSLIDLGQPLIRHKFEAWELGPVLPYLYREFKRFDRLPIVGRATELEAASGESHVVPYLFDQLTRQLLQEIVDFYSRLRVGDLVELSHVKGGPWHRAWYHQGQINPGMKIDDAKIAEFYARASRPFSIQ
jgi:uncharacterized phage-associated protein